MSIANSKHEKAQALLKEQEGGVYKQPSWAIINTEDGEKTL